MIRPQIRMSPSLSCSALTHQNVCGPPRLEGAPYDVQKSLYGRGFDTERLLSDNVILSIVRAVATELHRTWERMMALTPLNNEKETSHIVGEPTNVVNLWVRSQKSDRQDVSMCLDSMPFAEQLRESHGTRLVADPPFAFQC